MRDHLADWLAVRETVAWQDFPADDAPTEPVRDGAVHDIETVDRPRDPQRADRLLAALTRARATPWSTTPVELRGIQLS